nr:MAG TPA: hypothetical protein [Caudoviricetes sp.]
MWNRLPGKASKIMSACQVRVLLLLPSSLSHPLRLQQLNMTMRKQKIRLRLKPQIWRFHLRMYAQFFLIFPVKD